MLYKGFKKDFIIMLGFLHDVARDISFDTAYKKMYWPQYKPKYISEEISRMVTTKEITKDIVKGQAVYKITVKGNKLLNETVPLRRFETKHWDDKWRLVIFDISESKRRIREGLREKLKNLGFGKWQRSVYITPHNVLQELSELLENEKLSKQCACLEATYIGPFSNQEIAKNVFKLNDLNDQYHRIISKCLDLQEEITKTTPDENLETKNELKEIWINMKEVMLKDPYLPEKLIPPDWSKKEAKKEFLKTSRMAKSRIAQDTGQSN